MFFTPLLHWARLYISLWKLLLHYFFLSLWGKKLKTAPLIFMLLRCTGIHVFVTVIINCFVSRLLLHYPCTLIDREFYKSKD